MCFFATLRHVGDSTARVKVVHGDFAWYNSECQRAVEFCEDRPYNCNRQLAFVNWHLQRDAA